MDVFVGKSGELFPLSLNQQNIWDLERTFNGTSINSIGATIRIKGVIDFIAIEKAINRVIEADPSLRTQITIKDGVPMQYHEEYKEQRFTILDFTTTNDEGISGWESSVTREPIKFYDSPLYRFIIMRIREDLAGVLIIMHHIISDGWSQVETGNRIGREYLRLLSGKETGIEAYPSYLVYVEDEKKYLSSAAYNKDKKYWQGVTTGQSEPASLKNTRGAVVSPVGKHLSLTLPERLNNEIYAYCLKNRIAPFLVFYMALAIYLKYIGTGDKFIVGVPVFNRTSQIFKKITGMFVSTVPFFTEISAEWSFNELREHLSENWLELLRHQRFPFEQIKEMTDIDGSLFNIMLSYQDSKVLKSNSEVVEFSGSWHYSGYQAEQLCIHVMNLEENRRYSIDYDYLVQLFNEKEINSIHIMLRNILSSALMAPDCPVNKLQIITPEEYQHVVYDFNKTAKPLYYQSPFKAILKTEEVYPKRIAIVKGDTRLTYRDLKREAGRVAAALGEGIELTAILLPRVPKLFTAMAGIMQAGSAWLIVSPDIPQSRINEILSQSGAKAIISTREYYESVSGVNKLGLQFIDMDNLPDPIDTVADSPENSLAYVVYTSGSTGTPKGVEITKKSLLNFSQSVSSLYARGAVLSLCNIGFDAFVLESATAMLCGRTIVLPDENEVENPAALAQLIINHSVGFMAITPSRLAAYIKNKAFAESLHDVESFICGGEAFPSDLLQNLRQCTKARVYNQYGPSETTVGVSYKLLNEAEAITIGKPMDNCRLYILDENLYPRPVGVYGELCIGGVCVGKGYRNAPELTEKAFTEDPFLPGERIYRTGDIAAWTENGEIVLSGRRDKQVKLRGLRIELQEISACLLKHPLVTDAAVKVVLQNNQQLLLAYHVSEKPVLEAELLAFAATYLPRYMVPARIINLKEIPLTANGKVNEAALPVPLMEDGVQKSINTLQEQLVEIFSKVLNKPDFHAGSDYFLSGGNSLNAMEAIGEIEEKTGIRLRISDLYACRTVRRLDEFISGESVQPEADITIPEQQAQTRYSLTDMQKNVYVQSFMDSSGLLYNMPGAFRLGKKPDIVRLDDAFMTLIEEDDNFRTSFVQEGSEVVALISENVNFKLRILGGTKEEAIRSFVRPFDLSHAPLIRAALWHDAENGWLLLLDSHHIICDGVSTPIILERLNKIYSRKAVSVPLSYKYYANYFESISPELKKSNEEYWLKALNPLPEQLDIPLDAPRPPVFDYKGAHTCFAIPQELTKSADAYCERLGLTPYMFLLGVYGILLSKVSGQKDIIVGTPVSNRTRPELQKMTGLLINTLPLRVKPDGDLDKYFGVVKETVLSALDHLLIPLETLITKLNIQRSLSKNPLFQALFSMRPLDPDLFTFNGKSLEYIPISTNTTKIDLSFEVAKSGNAYTIFVEYCRSIFSEDTIKLYGRTYINILREILAGKSGTIEDINAISPEDKLRYIDSQNKETVPFKNIPINHIIESAALTSPEKPAIIWHGETISFEEFNKRADAIAALLINNGVKRGDRVGLVSKRTPDLLSSMLGILKAGAAYVPFLADYPADRICYMLENAGARLLLSDTESFAKLPKSLPCRTVLMQEAKLSDAVYCYQETTDPMYVLYTSGSTGQPKGVQVSHKAIANLLENLKQLMSPHSGPVLCTTNVTFDIFSTESLLALAQGLCVVLADEEEMILPWKTAELIKKHRTTITQFTPSRLQLNLSNDIFASSAGIIEFVILVGEAVSPQLVDKFKKHSNGRFVNMYGPTEAAVYVTQGELLATEPVNIGIPLNNCRIYILDEQKRPVVPTARGHMYLAGVCLADGYISRPDLTDEVFIPDPFVPGQKMYKSGDAGRVRTDGVFECFGRLDSQIKINGIRVETEEINCALVKAGAFQAATLCEKNPDGSTSLYGFVSPKNLNIDELKTKLSKLIPSFMIPSVILSIEKLPYNASGKVDTPILKKMVRGGIGTQKIISENTLSLPSINPTSSEPKQSSTISITKNLIQHQQSENSDSTKYKLIYDIWANTLGKKVIDPETSFFEQGGSSLGALNILGLYFNHNLTMTLAQFYENPTLKQQASLLGLKSSENEVNIIDSVKTDTAVPSNLKSASNAGIITTEQKLSYPMTVPQQTVPFLINPKSCFLLTGATGFLGAHMLHDLIERGSKRVICPLKDGDIKRLLNMMTWYFGNNWTKRNSAYIEVVKGDITEKRLGFSTSTHNGICEAVKAIYHSAADVRHFTSDGSSADVNLKGTENIIELALEAGIPLIHISTASISGEYVKDNLKRVYVFSENDFDIGQNWQDNVYIKTKFLAENAIYTAMKNRGLKAKVFRVGRIVGRYTDGMFQKNANTNAFYSLIRSIAKLGALPESVAAMPVEMTPVDICARAILSLDNSNITTYHLLQPNAYSLGDILGSLYQGFEIVERDVFVQRLTQSAATAINTDLSPLIEMFNRLSVTPQNIIVSSAKTQTYLNNLGFYWPDIVPKQILANFY